MVEAKSDGKGDRFAGFGGHERVMHPLVMREIGAVVINRLLKIAHHGKASGARRIDLRLEPAAGRVRWPRHFEEDGKLCGIGILGFIEDNDRVELANPACGFWMLEEFIRERDLVGVGDDTALETKIAIIALHFARDADRGLVHPAAQRNKSLLPDFIDALRRGAANRPPQKTGLFAITFLPCLELRDGIPNRVALFRRSCRAVNFIQLDLGTGTFLAGPEQRRAGMPSQLHDVSHGSEPEKFRATFR